ALEWIYSNFEGRDSQEKIHEFLRSLYTNSSLKWVLLVGDADEDSPILPIRYIQTNASVISSDLSNFTPTDHYYASLDTDWDKNKNGIYGEELEVDWKAEVYLGRLPADSAEEASRMINRILEYEKNPEIGVWQSSALLVGSLMDIPNNIGNESTLWRRGYYEYWRDNGFEAITNVKKHIPPWMNKKEMYDYNQTYGGNYTSENDTLDKTKFIAEFNKGYSIITSASHGWSDGDGATNYIGNGSEHPDTPAYKNFDEFYYWTDAMTANNGKKLSFWYVSGCDVGNFTEGPGTTSGLPSYGKRDTNFEQVLKAPDGGGIGLIAPIGGSWRGEDDKDEAYGNWWMLEKFWQIFFNNQKPGEALYEMKKEYENYLLSKGINRNLGAIRQNMATYNLLGDPEITIWTDIPKLLNVSYPEKIYKTKQKVKVEVRNDSLAIQNALICFSGSGVYSTGLTDKYGKLELYIEPTSEGTISLLVTAKNFLQFEKNLLVEKLPADISVENVNVSKSVIGIGEKVDIIVNISNKGQLSASAFDIGFYEDEIKNENLFSKYQFTSMQANESKEVIKSWSGSIGQHKIYVFADLDNKIAEYDENNNVGSTLIIVSDLDIHVKNISLEDSKVLKNGTASIGNGTDVFIKVVVESLGEKISNLYVRFFDGRPEEGGKRIETDRRIEEIEKFGVKECSVLWQKPELGMHLLYVVLDPNNDIKEYNEENNDASLQVFVNEKPKFSFIPNVLMDEDTNLTFELGDYVFDEDTPKDELTFGVKFVSNPNCNLSIEGSKILIFPKENWSGIAKAILSVSDGCSADETTLNITVNEIDDCPYIPDIEKKTLKEGEKFELVIIAYDGDNDKINFSAETDLFSLKKINDTAVFVSFVPSRKDAGIHKIKITASDGLLNYSVILYLEIIKLNHAPILSMDEGLKLRAIVGRPFTYKFNATDPDGDELSYSLLFEGKQLLTINKNGTISFTPDKEDIGEYNIRLKVSDGELSVERNFTLIIETGKKTNGIAIGLNLLNIAIFSALAIVFITFIFAYFYYKTKKHRKREEVSLKDLRWMSPERRAELEKMPRCTKCGSYKIQIFEGGEGICNTCGATWFRGVRK
ncbi:MAG: C25 family cysteine peptidase, partial [Candidatus Thermoplasmatota archaeon]